jgi:enoyl-CoA hydratase
LTAARPDFQTLLYDTADGIATVTLNQPDTRNALSNELLGELIAAFEAARDDHQVRCVVLTSSHDEVFSSGANLAGFAGDVPIVHRYFGTERFPRLFRLIGTLGKPTICAANGHVLAGALGIALACDLIVAKENATFGTPEINVGAFPFMIMALIYRNVPRKKTNELLLLGDRIDAREAERIGIVNKVVPEEEFDGAVREWAAKLASKSPVIMRLGKDAMYRQLDMPFEDALDYLRSQLSLAMTTEDIVEGVQAFFEKREPNWKGR